MTSTATVFTYIEDVSLLLKDTAIPRARMMSYVRYRRLMVASYLNGFD